MMRTALYRALIKAGAPEENAKEAATEVEESMVTPEVLKAELAAMEARIVRWIVAVAAVVVAVIKLIS